MIEPRLEKSPQSVSLLVRFRSELDTQGLHVPGQITIPRYSINPTAPKTFEAAAAKELPTSPFDVMRGSLSAASKKTIVDAGIREYAHYTYTPHSVKEEVQRLVARDMFGIRDEFGSGKPPEDIDSAHLFKPISDRLGQAAEPTSDEITDLVQALDLATVVAFYKFGKWGYFSNVTDLVNLQEKFVQRFSDRPKPEFLGVTRDLLAVIQERTIHEDNGYYDHQNLPAISDALTRVQALVGEELSADSSTQESPPVEE